MTTDTKTHDGNGNQLTFKRTDGDSWERTYTTTDTEFIQTLNGEVEVHVVF